MSGRFIYETNKYKIGGEKEDTIYLPVSFNNQDSQEDSQGPSCIVENLHWHNSRIVRKHLEHQFSGLRSKCLAKDFGAEISF